MRGGASDEAYRYEHTGIIEHYLLLKTRWQMIAAFGVSAAAMTFLVTRFLVAPRYRAEAVIRPVAQPSAELGTLGPRLGRGSSLGALSVLSGGLGNGGARAQEYMSILRSYDFSVALIEHYHLRIRNGTGGRRWFGFGSHGRMSQWRRYHMMRKRFDCQYDYITGNVTLHYIDRSRARAAQILGFYLESLRDKLRREQVTSAKAATAALRAEASGTSDTLLQDQLYGLVARQVQREELAQVEANFAFKVIDGPVVPDGPYSPWPLVDAILAGLLALVLASLWVILRDYLRRSHAAYMRALAAARGKCPERQGTELA